MKDKMKFRGDWKFTRVNNETGEVIDVLEVKNTVVNVGLNHIRNWMAGDAVNEPVALAIGTDNTAVQITDTALGSEFDRELAVVTKPTDYVVKYAKTFTFGVSETIYEAGLFDSDTFTGSIMIARVVDAGAVVSSIIDLIVEAEITISRV